MKPAEFFYPAFSIGFRKDVSWKPQQTTILRVQRPARISRSRKSCIIVSLLLMLLQKIMVFFLRSSKYFPNVTNFLFVFVVRTHESFRKKYVSMLEAEINWCSILGGIIWRLGNLTTSKFEIYFFIAAPLSIVSGYKVEVNKYYERFVHTGEKNSCKNQPGMQWMKKNTPWFVPHGSSPANAYFFSGSSLSSVKEKGAKKLTITRHQIGPTRSV